MLLVSDIIKEKNLELFNEAKSLSYVLYKPVGHRVNTNRSSIKYSLTHSDVFEPLAYSNNYDELLDYALYLGLSSYEILDNPCLSPA